jgi:hypothetical protein
MILDFIILTCVLLHVMFYFYVQINKGSLHNCASRKIILAKSLAYKFCVFHL